MQDFRLLKVWEKAHVLTLSVYVNTKGFPKDELYGITSQMRRSSASIPANIAEGCGRADGDFGRFLQIAMGSACELDYHLLLARDLKLLPDHDYRQLIGTLGEVKRMLAALLARVRRPNLKLKTDN